MIRHIINAFKRKAINTIAPQPQLQTHFPMKEFAGQFTIPSGWLILEMGQSPLHLLWYCQMVCGDDMGQDKILKQVFTEEHDDPFAAVKECNRMIKAEEYVGTSS